MESNNDRLEAHLSIMEPPIADDGFSEAVFARLPPKRLRARTARYLSLGAAACIGSVVTLLGVSPESLPPEILPAVIANAGTLTTSLLTSVAVIALFIAPVAWLVYMETADPANLEP